VLHGFPLVLALAILEVLDEVLRLLGARVVDAVEVLLQVLVLEQIDLVPQLLLQRLLVHLLPQAADLVPYLALLELDEAVLVLVFELPEVPLALGDDLCGCGRTLSLMSRLLRWMSFCTSRWVCCTVWLISCCT
jgi:hypothetical protein